MRVNDTKCDASACIELCVLSYVFCAVEELSKTIVPNMWPGGGRGKVDEIKYETV